MLLRVGSSRIGRTLPNGTRRTATTRMWLENDKTRGLTAFLAKTLHTVADLGEGPKTTYVALCPVYLSNVALVH